MKRLFPSATIVLAMVALTSQPGMAQQAQQGGATPATRGGGRGRGNATPPPIQAKPEELAKIKEKTDQIEAFVKDLKAKRAQPELVGDVEVYAHAGHMLLEYPEMFGTQAAIEHAFVTLDQGIERGKQLQANQPQWNQGKKQIHAYDIKTKNLTRMVLRETEHAREIKIDGQILKVKAGPEITLARNGSTWKVAKNGRTRGLHKTHALQGPIDDAFLDPFLMVRPTGTPWNEEVNQQALRTMARFDRLWGKYFRGHPFVKDDKDVTESDFAKYHEQIHSGECRLKRRCPLSAREKASSYQLTKGIPGRKVAA